MGWKLDCTWEGMCALGTAGARLGAAAPWRSASPPVCGDRTRCVRTPRPALRRRRAALAVRPPPARDRQPGKLGGHPLALLAKDQPLQLGDDLFEVAVAPAQRDVVALQGDVVAFQVRDAQAQLHQLWRLVNPVVFCSSSADRVRRADAAARPSRSPATPAPSRPRPTLRRSRPKSRARQADARPPQPASVRSRPAQDRIDASSSHAPSTSTSRAATRTLALKARSPPARANQTANSAQLDSSSRRSSPAASSRVDGLGRASTGNQPRRLAITHTQAGRPRDEDPGRRAALLQLDDTPGWFARWPFTAPERLVLVSHDNDDGAPAVNEHSRAVERVAEQRPPANECAVLLRHNYATRIGRHEREAPAAASSQGDGPTMVLGPDHGRSLPA